MINKEDLKDWLDESGRKAYTEKLEKSIDEQIKQNALTGNTTFLIKTGTHGMNAPEKTAFYDLWYTDEISKENRNIVHKQVIQKYRDFGFTVEQVNVDCGFHKKYFALRFKDIDKLIEGVTQ